MPLLLSHGAAQLRATLWGAFITLTYQAMRLCPPRFASDSGDRLARALGRTLYAQTTAIANENLQRLRPDLTAAQRSKAIERMWGYVGRLQAETAVIERLWQSAPITVHNEASVAGALRARRPILFVFPHLGNWELIAIALQRLGVTLNVVFEILPDPYERRLAERSRRRLGYSLITPGRSGVRRLLAALGRGEAVALAIDEYKHGNVLAPAFGRPQRSDTNARFAEKLARQFGALVIPTYCLRSAPFEFVLTFLDPIERASAAQLHELCESWIRAHPEQWYMLHRLRFA